MKHAAFAKPQASKRTRVPQELIDAIGDPLCCLDTHGRYVGCNKAFESCFGVAVPRLLGKTPLQALADPELGRVCQQQVRNALEHPGAPASGSRVRLADGARAIAIRHAACRAADGRVTGVVGIVADVGELLRLERELHAAAERQHVIADYMCTWEHWTDAAGRLQWVNPAVERVVGYAPQECYAMADFPLPLVHPDDRSWVLKAAAVAAAGGACGAIQHRMLRKDGSTIWVEVAHQAAYDRAGEFIGQRASVRDISAVNAAMDELFETQQMLQLVLDHIPQRVFWKDRDSRYLGANKAFLADLGLRFRHEIVGKTDCELPIRSNAERYRQDDQQVMSENVPKLDFEEPLVLPDGRDHWLQTSKIPIHDAQDRVIGVLGAYTDIAEQRATQSRLEETMRQLNAIVDNAQVGIAFFQNRRPIWINPAMQRILGYTLDEVNADTAVIFETAGASFDILANESYPILAAGKVYEKELRLRRRSGEGFWVQVRGSAIDATQILRGSIWIVLDIDAQKQAVGQLRELNATLARRVEEETAKSLQKEHLLMNQARHAAIGEMIGNIAHQWRQPLSVLSLIIQNLGYDFKAGSLGERNLDEYVAKALRAIEQMSSTIDDFRDFFKPCRTPQNFSIVQAIEDCADLVGAALAAHSIVLAVDGPRELRVFGYANEFSQTVLNIISNAKDALVERRVPDGRIAITVAAAEGGAVITVRDNAGGIAPEHLEKIFDPYFTTKEKGTGIGLYMTRSIVEQHMHGAIRAENAGAGALFTLFLPANLPARETP